MTQRESQAIEDLDVKLDLPELDTMRTNDSALYEISDDPDYQRLLPGCIEYSRNRPTAENPYLHGTGSYALRRILKEGLTPRGSERRPSGEAAYHYWDAEESPFVSLATDEPVGEFIARIYSYATSTDPGLSYNADSYFDIDRTQRFVRAMGGMERITELMLAHALETHDTDDVDSIRDTIRLEIEFSLETGLGYGQYVLSTERAKQNIQDIQRLLDGNIDDYHEIRRLLFHNQIFRGRPKSFVDKELKTLTDEESWLTRKLRSTIEHWKEAVSTYNALPASEREEIENQFPVVLLIEGKGMKVHSPDSPIPHERVTHSAIEPNRIREIRVPESKVETVRKWVEEAQLENVTVTPLEYYEIDEVVQSALEK